MVTDGDKKVLIKQYICSPWAARNNNWQKSSFALEGIWNIGAAHIFSLSTHFTNPCFMQTCHIIKYFIYCNEALSQQKTMYKRTFLTFWVGTIQNLKPKIQSVLRPAFIPICLVEQHKWKISKDNSSWWNSMGVEVSSLLLRCIQAACHGTDWGHNHLSLQP